MTATTTNRPAPRAKPCRASLVLLTCAALVGCGYDQAGAPPRNAVTAGGGGYQWRSLYREDVRTVAVPIFTNRTYRRNVEFRLTDSVIKYLESHTPWKVVPRERADTVLEGEVVSVKIDTISNDPRAAIPQEQLYTVVVNFTWKDLRTGQILVERRGFQQGGVHYGFEQSTSYYPTLGEGQFVASQQGVERLAAGIVQELQAEW